MNAHYLQEEKKEVFLNSLFQAQKSCFTLPVISTSETLPNLHVNKTNESCILLYFLLRKMKSFYETDNSLYY